MSQFNEFGHRVKPRISVGEYVAKLLGRRTTDDGREIVSSVPVAPPIGYQKQPSMIEHIRNMVRSEQLRQAAEEAGAESFEEADDFDIEDDPFPVGSSEFDESDLEPIIRQDPPTRPAQGDEPAAPEEVLDAAPPEATPPAAPRAAAPEPSTAPARAR